MASRKSPAELLIFGAGVGIGLGIWSTLSIVAWRSFIEPGAPTQATQAQVQQPLMAANGPPPPQQQQQAQANPMVRERPPMGMAVPAEVQRDLAAAPESWVSESFDKSGYYMRLSRNPPAIRVEKCDPDCRSWVAGAVVGLTPEQVTLHSPAGGDTVLRWKLSGDRMTLGIEGTDIVFKPGAKPSGR